MQEIAVAKCVGGDNDIISTGECYCALNVRRFLCQRGAQKRSTAREPEIDPDLMLVLSVLALMDCKLTTHESQREIKI